MSGGRDGGLGWMRRARCVTADPEVFFPEQGDSAMAAKRICVRCPVADECLEWALVNGEQHGVWGGRSERELLVLRRERRWQRRPGGGREGAA